MVAPSIHLTSLRLITSELESLLGRKNVRKFRNDIGWIEHRKSWIALRWVHVSGVSGQPLQFVRLRNDVEFHLPRSFWPLGIAEIPSFELTVHASEINAGFVKDLAAFVSALADEGEVPQWDIFRDPAFPGYSWSEIALENLQRHCPPSPK